MPVDETETSWRVRVRQPSEFQEGSFRTIDIDEQRGIKAVIGRLKEGDNPTAVQSFVFDKEHDWTGAKAEAWVREHGETPKALMETLLTKDLGPEPVVFDFDILSQKSEGEDLIIEGWATEQIVDRDKEVVEVSTLELEGFKSNPVLLYQHNPDHPIGQVLEIQVKDNPETARPGVWVKAKITSGTRLGEEVIRLVKAGVLRAFSIGGKAKQRLRQRGRTLLRGLKLFELSVVSIPANPQALFAISKGLGDYIPQVSALDITKSLEIGLASSNEEAIILKAMELAITSQSKEDNSMEQKEEQTTQEGGQEKQEAPAIPEELMAAIDGLKAQVAELSERVAALEGAGAEEEAEASSETPETKEETPAAVPEPAPERKGKVSGGQTHQGKTLDVRKMPKATAKALAERAWRSKYLE